jgi:hypothetical protein
MRIFKASPSSVGKIMTESRGKTKAEIIEELRQKVEAEKVKHEELGQKVEAEKVKHEAIRDGLKSKENSADRILKLESKLQEAHDKILKFQTQLQEAHDLPDVQLSETCKTFLEDWFLDNFFERRIIANAKQMDKGNMVEGKSIAFAQRHFGKLLSKYEGDVLENDFIRGICDVETDAEVLEFKSCYTYRTMPYFDSKIENKEHELQLMCYLSEGMYNKEVGHVCYTLQDMPPEMLTDEVKRLSFRKPTDLEVFKHVIQFVYTADGFEDAVSICADFGFEIGKYNEMFKEIEPKYRFKSFELKRDEEVLAKIKQRVIECRAYIETLKAKM